jgi:hypothetical protein
MKLFKPIIIGIRKKIISNQDNVRFINMNLLAHYVKTIQTNQSADYTIDNPCINMRKSTIYLKISK